MNKLDMREAGSQEILRLTNQEERQAYHLVKLITTRSLKTIIVEGSGNGDRGHFLTTYYHLALFGKI